MKILITTLTLLEKCGLGRYSLDLIRELAKENELVVYTAKEDEGLNLRVPNCEIYYIFPGEDKIFRIMRPWLFIKYFFKILPQARKCGLIHSFMDFPYAFLASVLGLVARKPAVSTAHGTYSVIPFFSRRWSGLVKWTYRRLDKIICVSNFTKSEVLKRAPKARCVAINNGINLDSMRQENIKAKKQTDANPSTILSVGMLKHRKGFHVSLKAVARVKEKYSDLKYYIVGRQEDKDYFEKLKGIVKEENLENSVVFLENISDEELKKLYCQTDLFVLTPVCVRGNFEGFGLVYLEAGAFGKPVVASRGSGSEDAVIDGETGLLVPQDDAEATAQAILKILDSAELAKKLGDEGRGFTLKQGWARKAKEYQQVYESLNFN